MSVFACSRCTWTSNAWWIRRSRSLRGGVFPHLRRGRAARTVACMDLSSKAHTAVELAKGCSDEDTAQARLFSIAKRSAHPRSSLQPGDADNHYMLGQALYFSEGEINEALESFERALEIDPKHAWSRCTGRIVCTISSAGPRRSWRMAKSMSRHSRALLRGDGIAARAAGRMHVACGARLSSSQRISAIQYAGTTGGGISLMLSPIVLAWP